MVNLPIKIAIALLELFNLPFRDKKVYSKWGIKC